MDELEKTPVEQTQEAVKPSEIATSVEKETADSIVTEATEIPEVQTPEQAENTPAYNHMDKGQLIDALKEIVDAANLRAHKEVALIKQSFYVIRNHELEEEQARFVEAGNEALAFAAMPDPQEIQFKELLADFREKRNEFLAAEEERKQANLEKKNEVLAKLQTLVEDIDNVNLRYNEFQQIQSEFKEIKDIPAAAETQINKTFQKLVEQFYDHLKMNKELRDLAFKKNLELKQALIDEAKALVELDDVVDASRKLQDLHIRWKDIGPVEKSLREDLWEQFRAASAAVNKRHQEFVMSRKANEAENEAAKIRMCEEAEAVVAETPKNRAEWDAKSKKLQDLQAEWKKTGFASKKVNNQLWARFRGVCDEFFKNRNDFYKSSREELEENLAKKTALCEQVEALKADESVSLRQALDKVQKLQAEWKTIGPVARKVSDSIWERFNSVCNEFFNERKRQNSEQRKEESANLARKQQLIERIKEIPQELDRAEIVNTVRAIQDEWKSIGHVPMKLKDKIYDEFRAEIDALFDKLGNRESRGRMSHFEGRVQKMAADAGKMSREEDKLQYQLEQKIADLKTYENNLGFFNVKSSAGGSMMQELERKISNLQREISELEEKLKMLRASKTE